MTKRAYERIDTNLKVEFFWGNSMKSGTVTNLSERGMCIKTGLCLPCDSKLEVFVHSKKEVLKVPVEVKRLAMKDGFYDTMGVQLLNQPPDYLHFVSSLKMNIYET